MKLCNFLMSPNTLDRTMCFEVSRSKSLHIMSSSLIVNRLHNTNEILGKCTTLVGMYGARY